MLCASIQLFDDCTADHWSIFLSGLLPQAISVLNISRKQPCVNGKEKSNPVEAGSIWRGRKKQPVEKKQAPTEVSACEVQLLALAELRSATGEAPAAFQYELAFRSPLRGNRERCQKAACR